MSTVERDALELCWEIEKFPASQHQTQTSVRASALMKRIATLESTLAVLTAERDAAQAEVATVTAERDALNRHYDAAGPEHNLLALLDLYDQRRRDAEHDAAELQADLRSVAEALCVVESYYDEYPLEAMDDGGKMDGAVRAALARPGVQAVLRPEIQQPC